MNPDACWPWWRRRAAAPTRFELAEDGLTPEQVVLTEKRPQEGTDDMAAWLIVAEVGMEFQDGAELEVSILSP